MAAINDAWLQLRDVDSRTRHDPRQGGVQSRAADHQPGVSYSMPGPLPATPPGTPAGSVLEFGRYSGWSLGQIVGVDPDYLEWLARASIGKPFKREIQALWASRAAARTAAVPPFRHPEATRPASESVPGRTGTRPRGRSVPAGPARVATHISAISELGATIDGSRSRTDLEPALLRDGHKKGPSDLPDSRPSTPGCPSRSLMAENSAAMTTGDNVARSARTRRGPSATYVSARPCAWSLTQVSLRVSVRSMTSRSGRESGSTQK